MAAPGKATCTGTRLSITPPLPIWPKGLKPQANTAPSLRSASVCSEPALTLTMFASPAICSGELDGKLSPLPSCPWVFAPHAHTVPSFLTAVEKLRPAATLSTLGNDGIWVGDIGPVEVLPRPSSPSPL